MGKTIRYGQATSYRQQYGDKMLVELKGRYSYFNDNVTVLEINAAEDGSGAEVLIQGSFESRATIDADELGPLPTYKGKR